MVSKVLEVVELEETSITTFLERGNVWVLVSTAHAEDVFIRGTTGEALSDGDEGFNYLAQRVNDLLFGAGGVAAVRLRDRETVMEDEVVVRLTFAQFERVVQLVADHLEDVENAAVRSEAAIAEARDLRMMVLAAVGA